MSIELKAVIEKVTHYTEKQTLPSLETTTLFRDLLCDALEQATTIEDDGTCFVKTGDIPAMWLRDATFQVLPYVQLLTEIPELKPILIGVLQRELRYVQHDPYANAFNQTPSGAHWSEDESNIPVSNLVWERKFEIDSLCAPLFLALKIYQQTDSIEHLDNEFWKTLALILSIFETEQHHTRESAYYFKRQDCPENDTLTNNGYGTPVGETGMIWNGFRPSDNASEYGYLVPANMFVVAVLRGLLPLVPKTMDTLEQRMAKMIMAVEQGISRFAVMTLPNGQQGYAYEVDGLGHYKLMDDANVPSLLSLPFIGYTEISDPLYQATRDFILSGANPYYYHGKVLTGIGSNHTPTNYVWPISLAMEGLTTNDQAVKRTRLMTIAMTTNATNQCHESISADDSSQYTREWFSWANMTYCQLALDIIATSEINSK